MPKMHKLFKAEASPRNHIGFNSKKRGAALLLRHCKTLKNQICAHVTLRNYSLTCSRGEAVANNTGSLDTID